MIKKNLIYNIIYQLLNVLLPIIVSPYISRVLGADGIGQYSYSSTVANYFVMFCMLGINNYGNRQIALSRYSDEEIEKNFWSIYTIQLIMTIVCSVLYLGYVYTGVSGNINLALVQSLLLISAALDINWFFFGLEKFKLTVTRNIVIKIIATILTFTLVKDKNDIALYAIIQSGSLVLSNAYIWCIALKNVSYTKPDWSIVKDHIKPILLYFVPVIAVSLYRQMDKIMLQILGNAVELGFYDNCERLIVIVAGLVNAIGTVMLPRTSVLISQGNYEESNNLLRISLRTVVIGSLILSCGIIAVSSDFCTVFWGKDFEGCGKLLSVLALTIFPNSMGVIVRTQYLIPYKKDPAYVVSVIIGAVVNIICNAYCIPRMGAVGAAIGTLCAEYAVFSFQFFVSRNYIEFPRKGLIATMLICGSMIFVVKFVGTFFEVSVLGLLMEVFVGGIFVICVHLIYSLIFEKDYISALKKIK